MKPIVQISLDLTNLTEACETAMMARRAGVDWLEAGTPLLLAEGLHGVRALREQFPGVPIVADLKTMDGGYLEAEMMRQGRGDPCGRDGARPSRNDQVCRAGRPRLWRQSDGRQPGLPRHGGGRETPRRSRLRLCGSPHWLRRTSRPGSQGPSDAESPESTARGGRGGQHSRAGGGRSVHRTGDPCARVWCASGRDRGAPLAVDADSFKTAGGDLEAVLREICDRVHAYGDIRCSEGDA